MYSKEIVLNHSHIHPQIWHFWGQQLLVMEPWNNQGVNGADKWVTVNLLGPIYQHKASFQIGFLHDWDFIRAFSNSFIMNHIILQMYSIWLFCLCDPLHLWLNRLNLRRETDFFFRFKPAGKFSVLEISNTFLPLLTCSSLSWIASKFDLPLITYRVQPGFSPLSQNYSSDVSWLRILCPKSMDSVSYIAFLISLIIYTASKETKDKR